MDLHKQNETNNNNNIESNGKINKTHKIINETIRQNIRCTHTSLEVQMAMGRAHCTLHRPRWTILSTR